MFAVSIGECETFDEAKNKMTFLIRDLLSFKDDDFGAWDSLTDEMPESIRDLIESYKETGLPCECEETSGDTETYHYVVSKDEFEIYESEDGEYEPSYAISTNTLRMNENGYDYYFRIWAGNPQSEVIILRMEKI